MAADTVLIELLSESLNAKSAERRHAAKLLLDSLRAGLPPEEISERIDRAEQKTSAACADDARQMAARLGVFASGARRIDSQNST